MKLTEQEVPTTNSPDVNRQFFFEQNDAPAPTKGAPVRKRTRVGLTASGALVIGALVGGAVGGTAGVAGFMLATAPAPVVVNKTDSVTWVTGAAAKALPSVVTISVDTASAGGSGSGVFLTADGYILTNTHVVTLEGSTSSATIQVRTTDGHVYDAKLIGTDPTNDLAVIKVTAPISFTPIQWADSTSLNVGDPVVALGAPLGLPSSVTSGVVSALNRTIQVADSTPSQGGSSLQWWNGTGAAPVNLKVIQTDAAINPGNSGGALVNDQGQLIGINVAIATAGSSSSSGAQSGSIGVGFAIPSNVAKRIGEEIMKTGKASHALLGALVSDYSATKAGFSTGAQVGKLTAGGPGETAGLKVGDIVVKFNNEPITSSGELTAAVRFEKAGSKATIVVLREGKEVTIDVTLGDLANSQ